MAQGPTYSCSSPSEEDQDAAIVLVLYSNCMSNGTKDALLTAQ